MTSPTPSSSRRSALKGEVVTAITLACRWAATSRQWAPSPPPAPTTAIVSPGRTAATSLRPLRATTGRTGEQGSGYRLDTVRDGHQRGCREADELGEARRQSSVPPPGPRHIGSRIPVLQRSQREQKVVSVDTTRSPTESVVTELPMSTTRPLISCPRMTFGSMPLRSDPAHHGNVVVAQAAGGDLDQRVSGARRRRFDLSDGE